MTQDSDFRLSPTVTKVLDAFLEVMKADEGIEDAVADRLHTLLRNGKTPKADEIDAALFQPQPAGEAEGAEGGDG